MYRLKFKEINMLCPNSVLNIAKTLGRIEGIQHLKIDLSTKTVILTHSNSKLSRQAILGMINRSINESLSREFLYQ